MRLCPPYVKSPSTSPDEKPSRVIVVRSSGWGFWLTLTAFASLLLGGATGLVFTALYARTSAERRQALAQQSRAAPAASRPPPEYPSFPALDNLGESPGVYLRYRLANYSAAGWSLLPLVVFSLVWSVLTIVMTVVAMDGLLAGTPNWLLITVTVVAVGICLWSFHVTARRLIVATMIGPTMVEISDHPVRPGSHLQLYVGQIGSLRLSRFEVLLCCEEVATFRQGTDIRTERATVHRETVFQVEDFRIAPGKPFEREIDVPVPAQVMHSFKSANNSVSWSLVVVGEVVGWTSFRRTFPLVVAPVVLAAMTKTSRRRRVVAAPLAGRGNRQASALEPVVGAPPRA